MTSVGVRYVPLRCAIPAELGRRVNHVVRFDLPEPSGVDLNIEHLAESFCATRGWMLISTRYISAEQGERLITEQGE